jgi:methionyl-tRNA synthetase
MTIRKFDRDQLASEPHSVLFKDIYPWEAIEDTPFGASLAVVEPGGRTMLHSHAPAETFIICRGSGTMMIEQEATQVGAGDVVYIHPHKVHDLRNDSATEDLVFVSVFWTAPEASQSTAAAKPRLILPSPPTANGPLHLGHMSGPYVMADVVRRYCRARGLPAALAFAIDEHQSFVVDRALFDKRPVAETAAHYTAQIVDTLAAYHVVPDATVVPSRDADYRAAVRERFHRLHAAGALGVREAETLYCETCQLHLYDSYVAGGCPQCGTACFGGLCEACCSPNDSSDLRDAICDRCKQPPARRTTRLLVLPTAPYRERLADHHRALRLTPKLRRLSAQWLASDRPLPASQIGDWGIAVELPGFEGQVISPWFEIALAAPYLRERLAPDGDTLCLFGYDNAYLYLVHDPVVSLALDPDVPLPVALGANEFLLLDNAKMSTSGKHALDARALAGKVPADLLRLYLAKVRPEDTRTAAALPALHLFVNVVAQHWQNWLQQLGARVATEAGGRAPTPANMALAPWSAEQTDFLAQLGALAGRARQSYEELSLKDASLAIHELVDRAAAFGATQAELAGIPSLASQRATGLALELAAARTLATIVAPVMPVFAEQLWHALGFTGAVRWTDSVDGVPPGQPIAVGELVGRRFFPGLIEVA